MSKTIAPYGSWKSPITPDLITAKAITFKQFCNDGQDIYWTESRPSDNGRYVLMRRTPGGRISACTPPEYYVRSSVHEYGGGAFLVRNNIIYFVNFRDKHLYRQPLDGAPELLTPTDGYRYADLILDEKRNRLICIREDHTGEGEAINTIVGVDLHGGDNGTILVEGNNFYATPRLSPDGNRLAWLTWNHPNMPWDGCELWVADVLEDGTLQNADLVAGSATESIFQPEWSPDGVLHFVAENTGWWNLYRWRGGEIEALCPMEAEFGYPLWVLHLTTYGFTSTNTILCAYTRDGRWQLATLDTAKKEFTPIETPFTDMLAIQGGNGFATFLGGSATQPDALVRFDEQTGKLEIIKRSFDVTVDGEYFSEPESIYFATTGGQKAHALHYPPRNKDYEAPPGERPPLLVISHGGPTAAAYTGINFDIQYWTSRGFAILDVNYGGSTGFGREYRQRLNGNWGIVDVDDCCNAALYLVQQGLADRDRLAIRGGSSGGYTTLACLAFRQVFHAGASHFGISDLEFFAKDTHKFESRYLNSLVGPYPERKDIYFARSPIHFIQNFNCPIILFQGDEDPIVPPNQSQMLFDAVRAKGIPTAYLLFKGEQHGFRKGESIKGALEGELYFYSRIFGFDLAEEIEPIQIENL